MKHRQLLFYIVFHIVRYTICVHLRTALPLYIRKRQTNFMFEGINKDSVRLYLHLYMDNTEYSPFPFNQELLNYYFIPEPQTLRRYSTPFFSSLRTYGFDSRWTFLINKNSLLIALIRCFQQLKEFRIGKNSPIFIALVE